MDSSPSVQYTLDHLYQRQRNTLKDKITKSVISYIQGRLAGHNDEYLSKGEYEVVGSTAENLVTNYNDDWDILFILGHPYTPQYFKSSYDGHSRHFLKWNETRYKHNKPKYVDKENRLLPIQLRFNVNKNIRDVLEGANINGLKVKKVFVWKQTIRALIRGPRNVQYTVDVIPQIKGDKWTKMDGVLAFHSLHPEIQSAVNKLESAGQSAVMYSLFAAPATSPNLLTTNYSLLEREFFTNNDGLRDIVLLGKMILSGHRWKDKYGLKSAHLKRIVMANIDMFQNLNAYSGMLALWYEILAQLYEGCVDGFFDVNSDLMWHKTESECEKMYEDVSHVFNALDPTFIPNYL